MITVLVNGLPGSGKTTLARSLAQALELPLFSKDALKETLADQLGCTPPAGIDARQWSRQLGAAAAESLWTLLADASRGAVLESPWLDGLRPVVEAGLTRAGARSVAEVWCEVPPAIARQRYGRRRRHPIHHDALVDEATWARWTAGARPLALGPVHRVDTTMPVDISALAMLCRTPGGSPDLSG